RGSLSWHPWNLTLLLNHFPIFECGRPYLLLIGPVELPLSCHNAVGKLTFDELLTVLRIVFNVATVITTVLVHLSRRPQRSPYTNLFHQRVRAVRVRTYDHLRYRK